MAGRGSDAIGTPPVLSPADLDRLRSAATWARFTAIVGFIASALLLLLRALMAMGRLPGSPLTGIVVMSAFSIAAMAAAAGLLWAYAQNVAALFTEGESALTRAFRNLRHFFVLWTLTVAFDTITTIVSMLV